MAHQCAYKVLGEYLSTFASNTFMSNITYTNLRHGIAGFFKYARIVLALPNPPSYVPFLHSNTSSLEAHFSLMRSCNADTPSTYQSKTAIVNNKKAMDEMNRNNKCYEANDETAINMSSLENLTGRRDKLREKIVNEWTHQGKMNLYSTDIPVLDPSQLSYIKECPGNLSKILHMICDKRITLHYRDYILSETILLEICKASVYTKSEECYKLFCCMNKFDEHETFNHGCQVLMTEICILFENSIAASTSSGKTDSCEASFWYQLYNFTKSDKFKINMISYFPDFIKLHYEMYYMILLKLVNIFEGWIQESITIILDTSSQSNTVNNDVVISEISPKKLQNKSNPWLAKSSK